MFITSILHRIFGKKTKKVEIAKDEKKLMKLSGSCENFQSLDTPSTSKMNAYELDLKLLKMRHQRNCKNINPRFSAASSLKFIKKSQYQSRNPKAVKSLSTTETRNVHLYPRLQPILPNICRVVPPKIHRIPTYRYVFRRTPVIRRRKFPYAK